MGRQEEQAVLVLRAVPGPSSGGSWTVIGAVRVK